MLEQFIAYLEEQVRNHSIYVWGGQGQRGEEITASWIRKRETSRYNAQRAIAFWRKQVEAGFGEVLRAFDCSGLGVYFLLKNNLIGSDMTADRMLRDCRRITRSELQPGDFVFRTGRDGRAYHVGYAVDRDTVIEAKGRSEGVVRSPVKGWSVYARPPYFLSQTAPRLLKLISPYLRGGDVLAVQNRLWELGFDPGGRDGVYGPDTADAVRAFQTQEGLTADGVVGPAARRALGWPSNSSAV